MFNFFESLSKENNLKTDKVHGVNMVFMNGELLYIEGHKGIFKLEEDIIVIKVKKHIVTIKGNKLFLKNLKKDTVTIKGEINNIELVWKVINV